MNKTVECHFEMADKILGSIHELTVCGEVKLTNNGEWNYDWMLLESCLQAIQQLRIVKVCKANKGYNGHWAVKRAHCVLTVDHRTVQGTVTLSRSGPELNQFHWNWTPARA